MNDWLAAGIAVAAGIIVGGVLARVLRRLLSAPERPDALRSSAGPLSSLAFSLALIVGLIVALGFVSPDALADLDTQIIDYTPKVLSAAIVLIMANVAGTFLATILDRSLGHVSPSLRARVVPLAKGSVMAAAGLIAANQIGVDTTILTLLAAALFFGVAAAGALVVGLGSRQVSAEVAAGRALRRLLGPGDSVTVNGVSGRVVSVHAVAVELEVSIGRHLTVPNSELLSSSLSIERSTAAPAD